MKNGNTPQQTEAKPQWTTYEVRPELQGNETLIIYNNFDGKRAGQIARPYQIDQHIEIINRFESSVQRVYQNVNVNEVRKAVKEQFSINTLPEHISNDQLDNIILRRTK